LLPYAPKGIKSAQEAVLSYVIAVPDMLASAAADVAGIGSSLSTAIGAAAAPTTGILAAAEDEVSTAIAAVFSGHGAGFQALGAQAMSFHDQFQRLLTGSATAYASTEASAVSTLTGLISAPPIAPSITGTTFAGTPSLLTRIENATLFPLLKGFFNLPVVQNQLATPGSPLASLFANLPNIPGINLLDSTSPPKFLSLLLGETVTTTSYQGMPVVQIAPAHPSGDYVIAIHGGGAFQPLIFQWINWSMMGYQTGATIEVPIYPLVQQGATAGVLVPKMAGFIESQITAHGASHVSVLGDSAGGNMALAATEYLVANNEAVPHAMVLISPVLDQSWSNPGIASIKGSWIPASLLQPLGQEYAGDLPINNYEVSPLYGSLNGLPPTTVYAGSQDIVTPDVMLLQQKAIAEGAPMSFVYANGETHDWLMVTPDTVHYWPQIDQELGI
jgi:triacylglycerol lipase